MRTSYLGFVGLMLACGGDDSTGPGTQSFAGTYPGTFYVIATSASPASRDSINGGAVTLSLTGQGPEYTLSTTTQSGGSTANVSVNAAGAMNFPDFDEADALDFAQSLFLGICDFGQANASPSGSVVGSKLTVSFIAVGALCDHSAAQDGSDIRPTAIQMTWTGTR